MKLCEVFGISEAKVSKAAVVHDARKFRWRGNEATGEAGALEQRLYGRLYDDPTGEGFVIAFPSGRRVTFVLDPTRTVKNADGDILLWVFKSKVAGLAKDMVITVYNE